jgi:hypothetical protein
MVESPPTGAPEWPADEDQSGGGNPQGRLALGEDPAANPRNQTSEEPWAYPAAQPPQSAAPEFPYPDWTPQVRMDDTVARLRDANALLHTEATALQARDVLRVAAIADLEAALRSATDAAAAMRRRSPNQDPLPAPPTQIEVPAREEEITRLLDTLGPPAPYPPKETGPIRCDPKTPPVGSTTSSSSSSAAAVLAEAQDRLDRADLSGARFVLTSGTLRHPSDHTLHYGLACVLSLLGQDLDSACVHLQRAVELGYRNVEEMQRDPYLATIRTQPGYLKALVMCRAPARGFPIDLPNRVHAPKPNSSSPRTSPSASVSVDKKSQVLGDRPLSPACEEDDDVTAAPLQPSSRSEDGLICETALLQTQREELKAQREELARAQWQLLKDRAELKKQREEFAKERSRPGAEAGPRRESNETPRTAASRTTRSRFPCAKLAFSPYYLRIGSDGPQFEPLVPQAVDATMILDPSPEAMMSYTTQQVLRDRLRCAHEDGARHPEYAAFHSDHYGETLAAAFIDYLTQEFAEHKQAFAHRSTDEFGNQVLDLCQHLKQLPPDPVMLDLESPVYVMGDIHGNFKDLQYFMANLIQFGHLQYTSCKLLFLGDYVDRGRWSVEVVAYVFALKLLAPGTVFLLRGNHELPRVNGDIEHYGDGSFKNKCTALFGTQLGKEVWTEVNSVFRLLPLAAVVDSRVFCVHGGIPRYSGGPDRRMELLRHPDFPRFEHVFEDPMRPDDEECALFRQMAMDLLWSDPAPAEDEDFLDPWGFGPNTGRDSRGVIKVFGEKAIDQFLTTHHLDVIIRAHEVQQNGVRLCKSCKVLTVFTSSSYERCDNGSGAAFIGHGTIRMVSVAPGTSRTPRVSHPSAAPTEESRKCRESEHLSGHEDPCGGSAIPAVQDLPPPPPSSWSMMSLRAWLPSLVFPSANTGQDPA